jgi:hypothetical protein
MQRGCLNKPDALTCEMPSVHLESLLSLSLCRDDMNACPLLTLCVYAFLPQVGQGLGGDLTGLQVMLLLVKSVCGRR